MASGKETPRQKMIGMMYLVLTALLALNVSKQILKGFVTVDEGISKSKLLLDENNARIVKAFEDYVKQGNYEAQPYLLKAIEAQKSIRLVETYIDSMKLLIVHKTESAEKKDTSKLRFMEKLDDYDTPTYILIGDDESKPKKGKYSAYELRQKLTTLHTELQALLDNMQKDAKTKLDLADLNALKVKLNTIKPVDRNIVDEGVKLNWELENFYHLPMAAVITNLDKIQADMKNLESEFLHVFAAANSKFLFKIDKLRADVSAPAAYVLAGQPFKANIVLGASSSELTPDRMEVLLGAVYDSTQKKLTAPGTPLPVKDGMGTFETVANSAGEKDLKGVVKYRNARGEYEYYPFDFSYTVAPPFTTIAADNMNIFYVGVDNPVSISAAGFSPADLKVSVSGCGAELKQSGAGNYVLTAKSTGTCMVTVMAKSEGNYKQQGPPKVFRVKSIPPPVLKIGNKLATSNLEFTRTELSGIGGLGVECPGFGFPVKMSVKSFDLIVGVNGSAVPYQCTGSNLTAAAKTALSRMAAGQKAYIDNIKIQTPTGQATLPTTQIKLKL